jgi:hypothetical protein
VFCSGFVVVPKCQEPAFSYLVTPYGFTFGGSHPSNWGSIPHSATNLKGLKTAKLSGFEAFFCQRT